SAGDVHHLPVLARGYSKWGGLYRKRQHIQEDHRRLRSDSQQQHRCWVCWPPRLVVRQRGQGACHHDNRQGWLLCVAVQAHGEGGSFHRQTWYWRLGRLEGRGTPCQRLDRSELRPGHEHVDGE